MTFQAASPRELLPSLSAGKYRRSPAVCNRPSQALRAGFGDDRRALVKYDAPGFALTSPKRTPDRSSSPIGRKCNVWSDGENVEIGDANGDVRLGQHLGDDIVLAVNTTRASEFDEFIRDQPV